MSHSGDVMSLVIMHPRGPLAGQAALSDYGTARTTHSEVSDVAVPFCLRAIRGCHKRGRGPRKTTLHGLTYHMVMQFMFAFACSLCTKMRRFLARKSSGNLPRQITHARSLAENQMNGVSCARSFWLPGIVVAAQRSHFLPFSSLQR